MSDRNITNEHVSRFDLVNRLRDGTDEQHWLLRANAADEIDEQRLTINGLGIGYEARGKEIERLNRIVDIQREQIESLKLGHARLIKGEFICLDCGLRQGAKLDDNDSF